MAKSCVICEKEIPALRLEAIPETRLCVGCSEMCGGDYEVTVVYGSQGKGGSLKKTSMDFRPEKRLRVL